MTPEQHNKYLGLSHLGYAAFQTLFIVCLSLFLYFILSSARPPAPEFPPDLFFWNALIPCVIFPLFTLPSVIAGYGLLKQKSWARNWGLVAGALATMSAPLGVALAIYSFWFLLGEGGKRIYENRVKVGAGDYVPPKEMPNWRD